MKLVTKNELIHGEHYFIEKVNKRSNKVIWKARGNYSTDSSLYKSVQTRREDNEVFAFEDPHVYRVNEHSKKDKIEWKKEILSRVYIYDYNGLLENTEIGYYYKFYHSEKEAIIKNSLIRNMSVAMKHTLSQFITDTNAVNVISDDFFPVMSYNVPKEIIL